MRIDQLLKLYQSHKDNGLLAQLPHYNVKADAVVMRSIQTLAERGIDAEFAALFDKDASYEALSALHVRLIERLNQSNNSSALELGMIGLECFDIKNPALQRGIITGCMLADIPNNLPYHSDLHYRKVLLNIMRMIFTHNNLENDSNILGEEDAALLMIAACVHDLGHDGCGDNIIDGIHVPGSIEARSYCYAAPFLKEVGIINSSGFLEKLRTVILCTDVTYGRDNIIYSNIMRRVFKAIYEGGAMPELPQELIMLGDSNVSLLACMLHEADVATSAGLSYNISKAEGALLARETGNDSIASAGGLLNFLNNICEGEMLTAAGKVLFQNNLEHIRSMAIEEMRTDDFVCG